MIRKSVSPKTLLSLPPFRGSIFVSHFSTSLPNSPHHYGGGGGGGFHSRRHDEETRNVMVSVWWDFENCHLPAGVNVFKVAQAITGAVRASGIKGPVQITAFGDVTQLCRPNQEALSSTGITLNHIPNGGKNSADRSLLVDLMYWVSQNPPPAHLFLISGDRDFASVLHRLRMNNYNILLASVDSAPSVLCSAASIMWNWNSIVKGDNLTGRYFNQPPDGSYGSWYGHYKVPLEDPFAVVEQPTCSPRQKLAEASSEPKIRPIPEAVMRKVRHILSLHPNGMSIGELRLELGKSSVVIDKDLYGYKKFSRFLRAMTHILKFHSTGDGQFSVHGITAKAPEPFEPNPSMSTGPVVNNKNQHLAKSSKSIDEDASISQSMNVKASLASSPEIYAEEQSRKVQQSSPLDDEAVELDNKTPEQLIQPSLIGKKSVEVTNEQLTDRSSVKEQDSASEVGFLKKFWRGFFGGTNDICETKSHDSPKEHHISAHISEKQCMDTLEKSVTSDDSAEKKVNRKGVKSSQDCDQVQPSLCSKSGARSTVENKSAAISSKPYEEESEISPGLFNKIIDWFKFWRNRPNSHTSSDQPSKVLKHTIGYSRNHQVFSEDSFWRDMESFMDTQNGLLAISQSKTRRQMAQNLQKEGPLVLRSLNESDVLQLVDMIISEKKWVEECPSEASPFKLTRSIGRNTSLDDSHASNGLRSTFLNRQSQSDLQRLKEQNGDQRIPNVSHAGVSTPASSRNYSGRSRKEILEDCQKLVNEVLQEFPEGYNMGSFRRLFLEKYGYHLDIQKLGYQKLTSLMHIMPGVKIESTFMIPLSNAPKSPSQNAAALGESDGELSNGLKKDDESDSAWEELGPLANIGSGRMELQSSSRRKAGEETGLHTYPEYDSSLSDDDFSDSDGESFSANQPEEQAKHGTNAEDSALIQILDSWYGGKEGDNRRDNSQKLEDVENADDQSQRDLLPSNLSRLGTKNDNSLRKYGGKQRAQKYTFVSAPDGNDKEKLPNIKQGTDKLLDGIICSLKK